MTGASGRYFPAPLEPWIVFRLCRAALKLRASSERALELEGLTVVDFAALNVIAAAGALSQTALGERIGVDRTTLTRVVDDLAEELLVARRVDPADGRRWRVSLTRHGAAALDGGRKAMSAAEAEYLGRLTRRDDDTLRTLLRRADPAARPELPDLLWT